MRIIVFLLVTGLVTSCDTEPFPVDSDDSPPLNQRLRVTAKHIYQINPTLDSLLPEVTIRLYKSEDDREYDYDLKKVGDTDSLGFVEFEYLKDSFYYVKATHTELGEVLEEVSMPDQATVSYLEVWYY